MSLRAWIVYGVLCLAVSVGAAMAVVRAVDIPSDFEAGSVIKIMHDKTHGSGVHIGNGYIVSAAHVVPQNVSEMAAKFDDGSEHMVEVQWVNRAHDIALLRLPEGARPKSATLACRDLNAGEQLFARGNPLNLEHITTQGFVAGKTRSVGPWRSATPVNMVVAGGMSGGGVFDAQGYLVAITVGTMTQSMGFASALVGIAYVVPGSIVCGLLARV